MAPRPTRCSRCTAARLLECTSAERSVVESRLMLAAGEIRALRGSDVVVQPIDGRAGRHTGFERRGEDERLERRAGLALGVGRAIERALGEVAAADQGAHVTRRGFDGDERRLQRAARRSSCPARRAAWRPSPPRTSGRRNRASYRRGGRPSMRDRRRTVQTELRARGSRSTGRWTR